MALIPGSGLPLVKDEAADGVVAQIFDDIQRVTQMAFIPNMMRAVAGSPEMLTVYWTMLRSFYENTTLPASLTSMMLYSIAETSNCTYCSAGNELMCRTLGVDESTLSALIRDLDSVTPERVRVIIEFTLKVAHDAQALQREDYEVLRNEGVTDSEIVEIIVIAAMGKLVDTMADALKVDVDQATLEGLRR